MIGARGTAFSPNVALLIAGRIVVGFGIGIAPTKVRGSLVSLNQLAITTGIVISYLIDYGLSPIQG